MPKAKKSDTKRISTLSGGGGDLSKRAERRQDILNATIVCVAKEGVEKISFESIGKEAGMRKGLVHYYFHEKSELLAEAMRFVMHLSREYVSKKLEKEILAKKNPVRAYLDVNLDWYAENPQFHAITALLFYYAAIHPEFKLIHTAMRKAGVERVEWTLSLSVPTRDVKLRVSRAEAIHSVVTQTLLLMGTSQTFSSVAQAKQRAWKQIEAILAI